MATLHFIYGLPGAGKTTLARRLGDSERALVFIYDPREKQLDLNPR